MTVAIDVGYSNFKELLEENGDPAEIVLPSGVCPVEDVGEEILDEASHHLSGAEIVNVGKKQFVACIDQSLVKAPRQRNPQYPLSDEYLALVRAGLLKTGTSHVALLVTGLPVEQYLDHKFRLAVAAHLTGAHEIAPSKTVIVQDVLVTAQPVGTYIDATISARDPLDRRILTTGRVAVLDIGFHTVDLAIFDQSRLQKHTSGSNYLGVSALIERVVQRVETEYSDKLRVERIEQALRRGEAKVLFHGQELDLTPFLADAIEQITHGTATDLLNARTLDDEQIDLVLLTGGGADLYRASAEKAFTGSRILVAPRPVTANARGYWKLGCMQLPNRQHLRG